MTESATDRDERLAAVLVEVLDDSLPEPPEQRLAHAVQQHPDLATELRELFATARIADDIAMLQSTASGSGPVGGPTITGSSSSSPIGSRIGDYELQEELGRGGMGVVYRAWQGSLKRTVALKMIPNAAFASWQELARLRAEALATAHLNHPNIVPVYEVGEHNGQPWFSMQYVAGSTLSHRLIDGPMPPRDAVLLLLPVIDAIGAAHRSGVLHRDLKPANILIAGDGTPFVTDFGLAKRRPNETTATAISAGETGSAVTAITLSGSILGTPAWMSPEQAGGQTDAIDVTSDIYSLGAVLYAMLTGRPPFQAATPLDTVLMVLEQDPPAIRMLNRAVDADLEMVVLKCLQKPQDLRYATTALLAMDLRSWLNNEPVSARASSLNQFVTRLFRESHHAAVLQNWGLLWMLHAGVVLVLCLITNGMQLGGVDQRWPYVSLWTIGLGLWALVFWNLRHRAGPITAVERQIAHIWGGSMIASTLLFAVEWTMGRPVLELSPVLGAIAGMVFLAKAGILSGRFYLESAMMFTTALLMAAIKASQLPDFSVALFGFVSGLTFFLPGRKYYRQQQQSTR
jgi:serine/threonine-protein kinase